MSLRASTATTDVVVGAQIMGAMDGQLGIDFAETLRTLSSNENLKKASAEEITQALAQTSSHKALPVQEADRVAVTASIPIERGGPSAPVKS
jgi:hypothetical protein